MKVASSNAGFLGNATRLPFPLVYSLRSNLLRHVTPSLLTSLAIGASVALAVALEMSYRSLETELQQTADALAGAAELEVTNADVGVPEELLALVAAVPGVVSASPRIDWNVRIEGGPHAGESLHILGVDFTEDRKVRGYAVSNGTIDIPDPLRLLAGLNSIIIGEPLRKALGAELGSTFRVTGASRSYDLRIQGVLLPGGVADAYAGQVGAMDVYALQELLTRRGQFDRIDIVREPGADLAELRANLGEVVAGRAEVGRPAPRNEFVDNAFGTVRLATWLIAALGIAVSTFLAYGALAQAVDRRTRELALLQIVGLEPRRVRRLVRIDALVLAAAGTTAGALAGAGLARLVFGTLLDISSFVGTAASHAQLRATASTWALALTTGMCVSLLGSLAPSRAATSRRPLEVLRTEHGVPAARQTRQRLALPLLATCAFSVLGFWPALLPARVALTATLLTGLLSVYVWIRAAAPLIRSVLRTLVRRVSAGHSEFIGWTLFSRRQQAAITITSLAAVVTSLVAILITVAGIDATSRRHFRDRYPGALIVTAFDASSSADRSRFIPFVLVHAIGRLDAVSVLSESFDMNLTFRGRDVLLAGRTVAMLEGRANLPVLTPSHAEYISALRSGAVGVSTTFARRFGVGIGDEIELSSPEGPVTFRIAALTEALFGPNGVIDIDLQTMDRFWDRDGADYLIVWPTESAQGARRAILAIADRPLFFSDSRRDAEAMTAFLNRFLALLYAIAAICALLGAFAIQIVLFAVAVDRKHDLAVLRGAGATRRWVRRLLFLDGVSVGLLGGVAGVAIGFIVSNVARYAILEIMGWELDFAVRPLTLIAIIGSSGLASGLGAWQPAWLASRTLTASMLSRDA